MDRKKTGGGPGKLTLPLLVQHSTDKKVLDIVQRFGFGLGPSGLSLCWMVEFLGVVNVWKKNPTVDGAKVIINDFVSCGGEAANGLPCRRGLCPLAGEEVLKKVCLQFVRVQIEMNRREGKEVFGLTNVTKSREKRDSELDNELFDDVYDKVYSYLDLRHFQKGDDLSWYLPASNVVDALLRVCQSNTASETLDDEAAIKLYKELSGKVLSNSVDSENTNISEAEVTAWAICQIVNHFVIIPPMIMCAQSYLEKQVERIAGLVMAHGRKERAEINRLERILVKIDDFFKQKEETPASLRLEVIIHHALRRLTTGVCSESPGRDLSTIALPMPTKNVLAMVKREIVLRQEIARLGCTSFSRDVTKIEKDKLSLITQENGWRHLTTGDGLKFPGEFRVNGKALPKESLKVFRDALAESLGEKSWESDRCQQIVNATSISALSHFGTELANHICPALFNTSKELRKHQDGTATNYDIRLKDDGSVKVETTVWYGVEWWLDYQEPKTFGRFCLHLSLHLEKEKFKKLAIRTEGLSFGTKDVPYVPYEQRIQVLEALQGIARNRRNTSDWDQRKIGYNLATEQWRQP